MLGAIIEWVGWVANNKCGALGLFLRANLQKMDARSSSTRSVNLNDAIIYI